MLPLHLVLAALFGWLEREQRDVIEFLREENRVLKGQLRGRRVRLSDDGERNHQGLGNELIDRRHGSIPLVPFADATVSVVFSATTTVTPHSGATRSFRILRDRSRQHSR